MKDKHETTEIDEELSFHLQMRIAENIASGMTPAQARANAVARFGDIKEIRQACLDADRGKGLTTVSWLLRCTGVCGVALWASGIGPNLNVLGEMLAIIAVLASLLMYLRFKTREPLDLCINDEREDLTFEQVSCRANDTRGAALRKNLGRFVIALCLVLGILAASLAIVGFSSRFLSSPDLIRQRF